MAIGKFTRKNNTLPAVIKKVETPSELGEVPEVKPEKTIKKQTPLVKQALLRKKALLDKKLPETPLKVTNKEYGTLIDGSEVRFPAEILLLLGEHEQIVADWFTFFAQNTGIPKGEKFSDTKSEEYKMEVCRLRRVRICEISTYLYLIKHEKMTVEEVLTKIENHPDIIDKLIVEEVK